MIANSKAGRCRHLGAAGRHFVGLCHHFVVIDDTDKKLLQLLWQDGRASVKALAGKLGLARSSVSERMARLQRNGVIRGYRVEVADGVQPQAQVFAFLLLGLRSTPDFATVAEIAAMSAVRRCASVAGDTDVVVELAAASIDQVNAARDLIAAKPGVARVKTLVVLRNER
jgi:DNA-binding Lrp family transcriptional regulator